MIGWFANAMMAMYDNEEIGRVIGQRNELLAMLKTVILNFGEIAGNHCDGCEELLEKAQLTIEKYEGEL
jgi:hypothetical protein